MEEWRYTDVLVKCGVLLLLLLLLPLSGLRSFTLRMRLRVDGAIS